ncbi:MAG: aminotransferase class I/II-fold pyridoxal phosphate-dependent enzyme [Clostridia bacterium]|nr:aminotransferase class I/II-fold pyridoxal phosphate-dependent enzyme [Clostridia bacterium]
MNILTADRAALEALHRDLTARYDACKAKGLKLDMSRGKPSKAQLDLCEPMLSVLTKSEELTDGKTDVRNYGVLEGIASCRALFAEILEVPADNVIAGGSSSLNMMYDTMMRLWVFGAPGCTPWSKLDKVKWLCPAPGYDRHFAICQQLGMEMITVPMLDDGPDMDMVEKLAAEDPAVKGIWCVTKYSNPEGKTYSDEVVRRFAAMKTAAPDFRIFWDNAYIVHHLTDDHEELLNIFDEAKKCGTEDRVLEFCSTSKISFAGAGVAAMAASDSNIAWTKKIMTVQTISADKINQLRHVRFFKDRAGIEEHMKKHAALLKPKFDMVLSMLEKNLGGTGAGSWHTPKGGYFISFDAMPGCAKRINQLCKEAGVVMTGAGATFPYGNDPQDSNLRIAPSLPPVSELEQAAEVFCVCALLAAVEKRLSQLN